MRKPLKIGLWILGTLAVLLGLLLIAVNVLADRKRHRVFEVNAAPVAFISDPAALAAGKYLFESRGCSECHGANGAGHAFVNDPNGLYVRSANITSAGVVAKYTERDWVRAIRHGVNPKGNPLVIMPSGDWARMTDADLAALVAYARSLPPVTTENGGVAVVRLPLMVRALYAFGAINDPADSIDHTLPPAKAVAVAVSPEHGGYVAAMCTGCHGPQFSGGKIPGTPPDWPPASNLTPGSGSAMGKYDTPEKFIAMLRTGKRPDGTAVSRVMPFPSLAAMNDTDSAAVYVFLKTLPPREMGSR
ncbi:MAG: c-type cytochrome [Burkholderiaceae bacterium]